MNTRWVIQIGAMLASMVAMPAIAKSPWDGTWTLDAGRSSPSAKDGAADGYRFKIANQSIVWEIPSLGEIVKGRIDGRPMPIRRREPMAAKMSIGVRPDGRWGLRYTVYREGKVVGGGRMMLVDDGSAWVDLSWGAAHDKPGAYIVYVKQMTAVHTEGNGQAKSGS